jgi:two-component system sensor histidine kinase RegB
MLNEGALSRLRSWIGGLVGRRELHLALEPRASVRAVREQIERRRAMLDGIDEPREEINVAAVLAIVRHHLPADDRAHLLVDGDLDLVIVAPVESFAEALVAVVTNALEANARSVEIFVEKGERCARFIVTDDGSGIPPRAREHLGEPFFTTKAGMGLGLFFAQSVAEKIEIDSVENEGTRVVITMPLAC